MRINRLTVANFAADFAEAAVKISFWLDRTPVDQREHFWFIFKEGCEDILKEMNAAKDRL